MFTQQPIHRDQAGVIQGNLQQPLSDGNLTLEH